MCLRACIQPQQNNNSLGPQGSQKRFTDDARLRTCGLRTTRPKTCYSGHDQINLHSVLGDCVEFPSTCRDFSADLSRV